MARKGPQGSPGFRVNWRVSLPPQILPSCLGEEAKNNSCLKPKRQTLTSVDEHMEKLEPSHSVGGNVSCGTPLEKLWQILKMLHDPAISLLGICPGELKHVHTKKSVHLVHSNTVHKN